MYQKIKFWLTHKNVQLMLFEKHQKLSFYKHFLYDNFKYKCNLNYLNNPIIIV